MTMLILTLQCQTATYSIVLESFDDIIAHLDVIVR
jgi:hypothetical protein